MKLKTQASKAFYLRAVRDVSLIDEDAGGFECVFDDVQNLREFHVLFPKQNYRFDVVLTNLYPLKPPQITLQTTSERQIGRLSFENDKQRLCNDEIVGSGWRPIRGVHHLLQLLADEVNQVAPLNWSEFLLGGVFSFGALAEAVEIDPSLAVAIVCEPVCPNVRLEQREERMAQMGEKIFQLFKGAIRSLDEAHIRQVFEEASTMVKEDEEIGVEVCVVVAGPEKVICANVGTVVAALLQTNGRQSRQISEEHDAFNEAEMARMGPDVKLIKHGATVRFIEDQTQCSRCIGLERLGYMGHDVAVQVVERKLGDSVLVVGNRAVLQNCPPLELSSILCPRISAEEMCGEVVRIAEHRSAVKGKAGMGVCVVCL
jgi:hypothetical protein